MPSELTPERIGELRHACDRGKHYGNMYPSYPKIVVPWDQLTALLDAYERDEAARAEIAALKEERDRVGERLECKSDDCRCLTAELAQARAEIAALNEGEESPMPKLAD